jgi:signal transduction histidine kinase
MNGIVGGLEVLQTSRPSSSLSSHARTLSMMRFSADLLLRTVNTTLDFFKLEAGGFELELVPFAPTAVISSVVAMFQHRAVAGGVTLSADLDPALPLVAVGDPHQLAMVLTNLISNAIKFTRAGGRVTVTVRALPPVPSRGLSRGDSSAASTPEAELPPLPGRAVNLGPAMRSRTVSSGLGGSASATGSRVSDSRDVNDADHVLVAVDDATPLPAVSAASASTTSTVGRKTPLSPDPHILAPTAGSASTVAAGVTATVITSPAAVATARSARAHPAGAGTGLLALSPPALHGLPSVAEFDEQDGVRSVGMVAVHASGEVAGTSVEAPPTPGNGDVPGMGLHAGVKALYTAGIARGAPALHLPHPSIAVSPGVRPPPITHTTLAGPQGAHPLSWMSHPTAGLPAGSTTSFLAESAESPVTVQPTDKAWRSVSGKTVLQVEVSDTGEGMTPEVMARLFTPWQQGSAATSRLHGGTGLGLVIAQRLVANLGGTLQVRKARMPALVAPQPQPHGLHAAAPPVSIATNSSRTPPLPPPPPPPP